MTTLYDLLVFHAKKNNYASLNDFLVAVDPKAKGSQTHIKKMHGPPPEDRLRSWAKSLKMTEAETQKMLDIADIERVYAAAKKNKSLGRGLELILARLQAADALVETLEARVEALEKKPKTIKR